MGFLSSIGKRVAKEAVKTGKAFIRSTPPVFIARALKANQGDVKERQDFMKQTISDVSRIAAVALPVAKPLMAARAVGGGLLTAGKLAATGVGKALFGTPVRALTTTLVGGAAMTSPTIRDILLTAPGGTLKAGMDIGTTLEDIKEKAPDVIEKTKDTAEDVVEKTKEVVERIIERTETIIKENPILIGSGAAAAGAAALAPIIVPKIIERFKESKIQILPSAPTAIERQDILGETKVEVSPKQASFPLPKITVSPKFHNIIQIQNLK